MRVSLITICIICFTATLYAQNISVDGAGYSPQQLIEDVLINNSCIQNIQVTNTVGGNFSNGAKSFGYFDANGSSFPLERGLILSTGQINHVPGPNTNLSDDDAPGWGGDADLEQALNISNSTNATSIEFDFVPNADFIQFRYLFASEEYQQNSPNTCIYSDAFAFLIKPVGGTYTNIALVPGTNTPVLVTTVHSGIPGACAPINEQYFESWNGANVPINFNGQTKILTAETAVVPNQTYHIKLVIADEANYRYDSVVFLEAESFTISASLGPDRTITSSNPLCAGEVYTLDATPPGTPPNSYTWYKNDVLLTGENSPQLTITGDGFYKVVLDFGSGCIATDEVTIEYAPPVPAQGAILYQCEPSDTGIATFNLFDATPQIIDGDNTLQVLGFYPSYVEAQNDINRITNPNAYTNTIVNETVYSKVLSSYNCTGIAPLSLRTTTNVIPPYELVNCSMLDNFEVAEFNLAEATSQIEADLGTDITVAYFRNYNDAIENTNALPSEVINIENFEIIYGRVSGARGCEGITQIYLSVISTPQFEERSFSYCTHLSPETITIDSGVIDTTNNYSYVWSTGERTATIDVDSGGTYTVTVTNTVRIRGLLYECSATNSISVIASETAEITYDVVGPYGNQNIVIMASGAGDYEYALHTPFGPFQESPIFENVRGGVHVVYVRDRNGCGITSARIYVLDFPKYFTPNNDGYHDVWNVKGIDETDVQITYVELFDRFGKLLFRSTETTPDWDGTYNGNPLPSSDYWFKVYFTTGDFYRGHFTMKR